MDAQETTSSDTMGDSRFNMWRTVFAMAHADGFLALEEQGLLYEYIETHDFSQEQGDVLREDVATAQNVDEMFDLITDRQDCIDFFELARALVWCDGDFDEQEQAIFERLKAKHDEAYVQEALSESRQTTLVTKLHDIFAQSGLNGLVTKVTEDGING